MEQAQNVSFALRPQADPSTFALWLTMPPWAPGQVWVSLTAVSCFSWMVTHGGGRRNTEGSPLPSCSPKCYRWPTCDPRLTWPTSVAPPESVLLHMHWMPKHLAGPDVQSPRSSSVNNRHTPPIMIQVTTRQPCRTTHATIHYCIYKAKKQNAATHRR